MESLAERTWRNNVQKWKSQVEDMKKRLHEVFFLDYPPIYILLFYNAYHFLKVSENIYKFSIVVLLFNGLMLVPLFFEALGNIEKVIIERKK